MKNLIRILLYLLLVLLVVAIAYMIYKRSKTPVDDIPPTSEMTDSLFMDQHQHNQTALTSEDSMVLDLTGQLPDKVGAPAENQSNTQGESVNSTNNMPSKGTIDYSKPVPATEQSAAVNTNPKAQKVSEKVSSPKAETSTSNKTASTTKNRPSSSTKPATAAKTSMKPAEKKADTKKPIAKPAASSTAGFYVISGSFIVPAHADDQVKKLKKMGYTTAMKKVFGSSEYYSAVVGTYNSRQDAEKIVNKLTGKGEKAFLKAK
ncbi:MAG: SPOR domain-containing protein [Saprospiraceae bacterium]|nr:SPOR domain-containing protein [Saprospiraceae bacterium]